MTKRFIFTFLFLNVFFLSPNLWAQQEFFPFLAEVSEENVNVRAGQNKNFERLIQLKKGEEVIVIDKNFSWYKIQLPKESKVYISDKYLARLKGNQGEVTGSRVNVRAGPGINFSVVGQVSLGDQLGILDYKDGWYNISPPATSYGWVKEDLIIFKSNATQTHQESQAEKDSEEAHEEEPVTRQDTSTGETLIVVEGKLSPVKGFKEYNIHYQLSDPPKPSYLIRGLSDLLDNFKGLYVQIEGITEKDSEQQFDRPVLSVLRIKLIL